MTTTPIRIRVLPRYPARILADTGIAAERRTTAPDITITSDYPSLGQTVIGDASMSFVKMYDATNAGYSVISVSQLLLGDPFGSNNVWTGTNAFNAGVTISGGITGTVPGNHTYSGNITFSGTVSFSGSLTFADNAFTLADNADSTKKAVFQLDKISTGQTRILTLADRNFNVDGVARGYLFGLTLSNNVTDATNDIDIAAGEAASDDAVAWNMILGSALTKRLDAAWAVGNNQGGLDTGSIANTTYYLWLIQRSDTGVVDALFSASISAPTMPANYDRKRRIGSIVRIGGAIKPFLQNGDVYTWVDPAADVNTTNPGTSAVLSTLTVPIGGIFEVFGIVQHNSNVAVADQILYMSDPRMTNAVPDNTQYFTETHRSGGALVRNSVPFKNFCNVSGQVRYRVNASDAATIVRITTTGWIDTRGRV